jgi:RNA polymerase sigma-70 factor (ECF subfamily)
MNDPGCTEKSLVEKSAEGDKNAFETLMRDYVKILYNYIYLRVPNGADAEDILQETMLSAWRGIGSFNYASSLKTWVMGIANNKINDFFRNSYRFRTETLDDQAEVSDGCDFTKRAVIRGDLQNALSSLEPEEKHLVYLIFNAQLSYPEISQVTGIPVGTIKSRMSAIKEKLKKRLGEGYYG